MYHNLVVSDKCNLQKLAHGQHQQWRINRVLPSHHSQPIRCSKRPSENAFASVSNSLHQVDGVMLLQPLKLNNSILKRNLCNKSEHHPGCIPVQDAYLRSYSQRLQSGPASRTLLFSNHCNHHGSIYHLPIRPQISLRSYHQIDPRELKMETGKEAPCRPFYDPTKNPYSLTSFQTLGRILRALEPKDPHPGITKLHNDFNPPVVFDDPYDCFEFPYPKRTWHARPYWYRSPMSFFQHPDNDYNRFQQYIANIFLFRGDYNNLNLVVRYATYLWDMARNKSYAVSEERLEQVLRILRRIKSSRISGSNYSEQIPKPERVIRDQLRKYRIYMFEDWKNFWRNNPPLEPWATPAGLADPDPHILIQNNPSYIGMRDLPLGSSAIEDNIEMMHELQHRFAPIEQLKMLIVAPNEFLFPDRTLLPYAIETRERERRTQTFPGSMNAGAMNMIFEFTPGWNHATHMFDYGRRNTVDRQIREEDEMRNRFPEPLEDFGRRRDNYAVHINSALLWRCQPDPAFSHYAYISQVDTLKLMTAFQVGDKDEIKALIPEHVRARPPDQNKNRYWLGIFSPTAANDHMNGDWSDASEYEEQELLVQKSSSYFDTQLITDERFRDAANLDGSDRPPMIKSEIDEAMQQKVQRYLESYGTRLESNVAYIGFKENLKYLLFGSKDDDSTHFVTRVFELFSKDSPYVPVNIKIVIKEVAKETIKHWRSKIQNISNVVDPSEPRLNYMERYLYYKNRSRKTSQPTSSSSSHANPHSKASKSKRNYVTHQHLCRNMQVNPFSSLIHSHQSQRPRFFALKNPHKVHSNRRFRLSLILYHARNYSRPQADKNDYHFQGTQSQERESIYDSLMDIFNPTYKNFECSSQTSFFLHRLQNEQYQVSNFLDNGKASLNAIGSSEVQKSRLSEDPKLGDINKMHVYHYKSPWSQKWLGILSGISRIIGNLIRNSLDSLVEKLPPDQLQLEMESVRELHVRAIKHKFNQKFKDELDIRRRLEDELPGVKRLCSKLHEQTNDIYYKNGEPKWDSYEQPLYIERSDFDPWVEMSIRSELSKNFSKFTEWPASMQKCLRIEKKGSSKDVSPWNAPPGVAERKSNIIARILNMAFHAYGVSPKSSAADSTAIHQPPAPRTPTHFFVDRLLRLQQHQILVKTAKVIHPEAFSPHTNHPEFDRVLSNSTSNRGPFLSFNASKSSSSSASPITRLQQHQRTWKNDNVNFHTEEGYKKIREQYELYSQEVDANKSHWRNQFTSNKNHKMTDFEHMLMSIQPFLDLCDANPSNPQAKIFLTFKLEELANSPLFSPRWQPQDPLASKWMNDFASWTNTFVLKTKPRKTRIGQLLQRKRLPALFAVRRLPMFDSPQTPDHLIASLGYPSKSLHLDLFQTHSQYPFLHISKDTTHRYMDLNEQGQLDYLLTFAQQIADKDDPVHQQKARTPFQRIEKLFPSPRSLIRAYVRALIQSSHDAIKPKLWDPLVDDPEVQPMLEELRLCRDKVSSTNWKFEQLLEEISKQSTQIIFESDGTSSGKKIPSKISSHVLEELASKLSNEEYYGFLQMKNMFDPGNTSSCMLPSFEASFEGLKHPTISKPEFLHDSTLSLENELIDLDLLDDPLEHAVTIYHQQQNLYKQQLEDRWDEKSSLYSVFSLVLDEDSNMSRSQHQDLRDHCTIPRSKALSKYVKCAKPIIIFSPDLSDNTKLSISLFIQSKTSPQLISLLDKMSKIDVGSTQELKTIIIKINEYWIRHCSTPRSLLPFDDFEKNVMHWTRDDYVNYYAHNCQSDLRGDYAMQLLEAEILMFGNEEEREKWRKQLEFFKKKHLRLLNEFQEGQADESMSQVEKTNEETVISNEVAKDMLFTSQDEIDKPENENDTDREIAEPPSTEPQIAEEFESVIEVMTFRTAQMQKPMLSPSFIPASPAPFPMAFSEKIAPSSTLSAQATHPASSTIWPSLTQEEFSMRILGFDCFNFNDPLTHCSYPYDWKTSAPAPGSYASILTEKPGNIDMHKYSKDDPTQILRSHIDCLQDPGVALAARLGNPQLLFKALRLHLVKDVWPGDTRHPSTISYFEMLEEERRQEARDYEPLPARIAETALGIAKRHSITGIGSAYSASERRMIRDRLRAWYGHHQDTLYFDMRDLLARELTRLYANHPNPINDLLTATKDQFPSSITTERLSFEQYSRHHTYYDLLVSFESHSKLPAAELQEIVAEEQARFWRQLQARLTSEENLKEVEKEKKAMEKWSPEEKLSYVQERQKTQSMIKAAATAAQMFEKEFQRRHKEAVKTRAQQPESWEDKKEEEGALDLSFGPLTNLPSEKQDRSSESSTSESISDSSKKRQSEQQSDLAPQFGLVQHIYDPSQASSQLTVQDSTPPPPPPPPSQSDSSSKEDGSEKKSGYFSYASKYAETISNMIKSIGEADRKHDTLMVNVLTVFEELGKGFNKRIWRVVLSQAFAYLFLDFSAGRYNVIRLVATHEVVDKWRLFYANVGHEIRFLKSKKPTLIDLRVGPLTTPGPIAVGDPPRQKVLYSRWRIIFEYLGGSPYDPLSGLSDTTRRIGIVEIAAVTDPLRENLKVVGWDMSLDIPKKDLLLAHRESKEVRIRKKTRTKHVRLQSPDVREERVDLHNPRRYDDIYD